VKREAVEQAHELDAPKRRGSSPFEAVVGYLFGGMAFIVVVVILGVTCIVSARGAHTRLTRVFPLPYVLLVVLLAVVFFGVSLNGALWLRIETSVASSTRWRPVLLGVPALVVGAVACLLCTVPDDRVRAVLPNKRVKRMRCRSTTLWERFAHSLSACVSHTHERGRRG
jgi:hypothetical protein